MKKFIDIICISHENFRLIRLFFIIYVYLFITCIYNHFYMILLAPTENTKGYAILWDVRPIYDEYLITFWRWWDHMSISYTVPKNYQNLTFLSLSIELPIYIYTYMIFSYKYTGLINIWLLMEYYYSPGMTSWGIFCTQKYQMMLALFMYLTRFLGADIPISSHTRGLILH